MADGVQDINWLGHAASGIIGAVVALISKAFFGGVRVGKMQGAIEVKITEAEQRIGTKIESETGAFDETLKGLRQKINDVELAAERRFLLKDDFDKFHQEYRDNTREIMQLIRGSGHK